MNTPIRVPLPVSPHKPPPYSGPDPDEILAHRRAFVNPGVFTYYPEPLCVVAGHMQYVWDETGRQYLDALGGIVTISVGHCHPHVSRRLHEQIDTLVHATTIYLHPSMPLFARKIAATFAPASQLTSTYFLNAGNEANELAVLLARMHAGRSEILSLRNAYHGGSQVTQGLTAVGTWKFPVAPAAGIVHVPAPYCYRCPFGLKHPSCELKCARSIEDTIRHETSGEIAGFIAETIQGVGGVVTPPPEYFKIVYETVRKFGGICIADEVQSGWGRTGTAFWGFENWGVTPDAVTSAKGIANGFPVSMCTTRPEIAAHTKKRVHFNTFGGNPLAMAAGLATLEAMEQDQTQRVAREMGDYLRSKLLAMQEKLPQIGEVRGMGLMLGIELVMDPGSRTPAGPQTASVMERCRKRGLLIGRGGLFGNVIRIAPPMCIGRADCDFLADCLSEAIQGVFEQT